MSLSARQTGPNQAPCRPQLGLVSQSTEILAKKAKTTMFFAFSLLFEGRAAYPVRP